MQKQPSILENSKNKLLELLEKQKQIQKNHFDDSNEASEDKSGFCFKENAEQENNLSFESAE